MRSSSGIGSPSKFADADAPGTCRAKALPVGAPSVLSPEIVIPSAARDRALSRVPSGAAVLLPESLPGRLLLRPRVFHPDSPVASSTAIRRLPGPWQALVFRRAPGQVMCMTGPFFFGYGSLVNRATHDYSDAHPARIEGWRRAWRHVEGRKVAFLTAVPAP